MERNESRGEQEMSDSLLSWVPVTVLRYIKLITLLNIKKVWSDQHAGALFVISRRTIAFRCYHSSDSYTDVQALPHRYRHMYSHKHSCTSTDTHVHLKEATISLSSRLLPLSYAQGRIWLSLQKLVKNPVVIKCITRTSKEWEFSAPEVSFLWFHAQRALKVFMECSHA